MPFVEDPALDDVDDVPIPNIGTDLFDVLSDEEPVDSGPVVPEILQVEEVETVVRLDDAPGNEIPHEGNGNGVKEQESGDEDEEDIPAAVMSDEALVSSPPAKKRGRPSLAASRSATPKAVKSTAGRKRKAEVSEDEPATKRSGRGRATAAAASESIKQASAKRPRAAPGAAKAAPKAKATGAKRGPKPGLKAKKEAKEEAGEYEVEKIVDDDVQGNSKRFFVKWKGYPDDQNTWEPKKNLAHAADLLKEYEATKEKETKKPGPKKAAAAAAAPATEKKAAPAKKGPAKKGPAKKAAPVKKASHVKKAAVAKTAGVAARPGRRAGRPKRH